jgi:hypothetical protein
MLGQTVAGTIQAGERERGKFVGHAVRLSLKCRAGITSFYFGIKEIKRMLS